MQADPNVARQPGLPEVLPQLLGAFKRGTYRVARRGDETFMIGSLPVGHQAITHELVDLAAVPPDSLSLDVHDLADRSADFFRRFALGELGEPLDIAEPDHRTAFLGVDMALEVTLHECREGGLLAFFGDEPAEDHLSVDPVLPQTDPLCRRFIEFRGKGTGTSLVPESSFQVGHLVDECGVDTQHFRVLRGAYRGSTSTFGLPAAMGAKEGLFPHDLPCDAIIAHHRTGLGFDPKPSALDDPHFVRFVTLVAKHAAVPDPNKAFRRPLQRSLQFLWAG